MDKELIGAGIFFVIIFTFILLIPCVLIAYIGFRMITQLGYFPSKTPAIQLSILWKLVAIEIISISALLILYQALGDPNKKDLNFKSAKALIIMAKSIYRA